MSFVGIGMQLGANAASQLGVGKTDMPRQIANIVYANGTSLTKVIQADITVEETHTSTMEVTQHPIQQGSAISDHVYRLNPQITVIMGWSTSPVAKNSLVSEALGYASTRSSLVNTAANFLGAVQGVANLLGSQTSRAKMAFQQLTDLQLNSALFDLSTGKKLYKNVVCTSVTFTDNYKTANAIFITATFNQLYIVPLGNAQPSASAKGPTGAVAGVLATGVKAVKVVSTSVSNFMTGLGVSL